MSAQTRTFKSRLTNPIIFVFNVPFDGYFCLDGFWFGRKGFYFVISVCITSFVYRLFSA